MTNAEHVIVSEVLVEKKSTFRKILTHIESDPTSWSLIFANIVTAITAVVNNLDVSEIIYVYYCQSIIIGIFTIVKILNFPIHKLQNEVKGVSPALTKRFIAGYFFIHYGLFHLVYLIFIGIPTSNLLFTMILPISIFFINHAYSIFYNRKNDEMNQTKIMDVFFEPYPRILPIHFFILFSPFVGVILYGVFYSTVILGIIPKSMLEAFIGIIALVFFLVLKTFVDVIFHVNLHLPVHERFNLFKKKSEVEL